MEYSIFYYTGTRLYHTSFFFVFLFFKKIRSLKTLKKKRSFELNSFRFRFYSLFGFICKPFVNRNNGRGKRLDGCTRKAVDYRTDRMAKNDK